MEGIIKEVASFFANKEPITCANEHRFGFEEGVKREWKDKLMSIYLECPACHETQHCCYVSRDAVKKHAVMVRAVKKYQKEKNSGNYQRYRTALKKWQVAFDHSNRSQSNTEN